MEWCTTIAGDPYPCDCSDPNAPDFPCGSVGNGTTPGAPSNPTTCGDYGGDILATVQALGFTSYDPACFQDVYHAYCDPTTAASLCGTGTRPPAPGARPLYDCVGQCDQTYPDDGVRRTACVRACAPLAPCQGILGCNLPTIPGLNLGTFIILGVAIVVLVGLQDVRAFLPARRAA